MLSGNSVSNIFQSLILTWYQLIRLKLLVYLSVCFKFLWLLMYICIYLGPHGRLAITCIFVYAKCCHPLKIKSLLSYLLTYSVILFTRLYLYKMPVSEKGD